MSVRDLPPRVKNRVSVRIRRASPSLPLEPGLIPAPLCPECREPMLVHVDPDDGPELLCARCTCWVVAK